MINPKYHDRLKHLISLARALDLTGNFCTKGLSRIQVCAIVNTSEIMKSRGVTNEKTRVLSRNVY